MVVQNSEVEPEPVIRARGIVKDFGRGDAKIRVLHGIDLDVYGGEMTFLIGESGSGKTTFISILSAILTADQGSVEVFGTDFGGAKVSDLANFRRDTIGFAFQQFNLLPTLTALENASLALLASGVSRKQAEARSLEMLERLGIAAQAYKKPNQLSGGQQQRVAIARALVHEPCLVVCDEPTASLDAKSGQAVIELLRDIAVQPDRAVLIVTHDARTYRYADRVVQLEDGRITSDRRDAFGELN